eukprot:TRINITY_DN783_c0_g1_i1.p2 TRINITY_DN783_c0_g1~~TRINITY_DN783_c0_g1_i1.p2  ORF type:complete len:102 (+),score=16.72 TRINITY_DN783_c0_g1_i1:210-515(+)
MHTHQPNTSQEVSSEHATTSKTSASNTEELKHSPAPKPHTAPIVREEPRMNTCTWSEGESSASEDRSELSEAEEEEEGKRDYNGRAVHQCGGGLRRVLFVQ